MQDKFFFKKRRNLFLILLLIILIAYSAIDITQFSIGKMFSSIPRSIIWSVTNFYPTSASFSHLPDIINKMVQTIFMSIASVTFAAIFAFIFAICGSKTTRANAFIGTIARGIATLFRNIDVTVWSMILLFSFGQNALTGLFALFFGSFGFLTRAFIETIDEVGENSVEALQATGASYSSVIVHSVIPSSIPQMVSWLLFMIENNIRSATLIGILTGTGIGFAFDIQYKDLNYHVASLIVIVIVITILLLEFISNYVRRVIL